MSKKITAARRAAFLRAVGETGNQTLAAERVRVSRSWVRLQRRGDAGFDAAVRAAVAAAKDRLQAAAAAADGSGRPPKGWGHLDGVELTVRGTGGSGGAGEAGGRRVQIARARVDGWSPAVERRFLDALGATCNVKAACAEVGRSKGSAYAHRKRWPAFARTWDQVLEEAYASLEIALLENAENLFSVPDYVPDTAIRDMTVADAIHLLHVQRNKVLGTGRPAGQRWRAPRTLDDVRGGILRKLEALERGRWVDADADARRRRDWAARRGEG